MFSTAPNPTASTHPAKEKPRANQCRIARCKNSVSKKKNGLQRFCRNTLISLVEMRRIELLAYALRTLLPSIPD